MPQVGLDFLQTKISSVREFFNKFRIIHGSIVLIKHSNFDAQSTRRSSEIILLLESIELIIGLVVLKNLVSKLQKITLQIQSITLNISNAL